MSGQIRQVIELPIEEYDRMKETQERILKALENLSLLPSSTPEFLTAHEFMKRCKISRWLLDELRAQGKLRSRKVGRKIFIEIGEVDRFFNGQLHLAG